MILLFESPPIRTLWVLGWQQCAWVNFYPHRKHVPVARCSNTPIGHLIKITMITYPVEACDLVGATFIEWAWNWGWDTEEFVRLENVECWEGYNVGGVVASNFQATWRERRNSRILYLSTESSLQSSQKNIPDIVPQKGQYIPQKNRSVWNIDGIFIGRTDRKFLHESRPIRLRYIHWQNGP